MENQVKSKSHNRDHLLRLLLEEQDITVVDELISMANRDGPNQSFEDYRLIDKVCKNISQTISDLSQKRDHFEIVKRKYLIRNLRDLPFTLECLIPFKQESIRYSDIVVSNQYNRSRFHYLSITYVTQNLEFRIVENREIGADILMCENSKHGQILFPEKEVFNALVTAYNLRGHVTGLTPSS
jgi:hypothetical protein